MRGNRSTPDHVTSSATIIRALSHTLALSATSTVIAATPTASPPILVERKEKKRESEFAFIDLTDFRGTYPSHNKLLENFSKTETLPKSTFHQVHKVIEESLTEIKNYFFKENPPGSKPHYQHISELEAAVAGCYKLLAPYNTANTYAVYDKTTQKYVGVVSEEIPGFKSTAVDPLKEEDLNIDFIEEKKLSLDLLETWEKKIIELNKISAQIAKKAEKIDADEKRIDAKRKFKLLATAPTTYTPEEIKLLNTKNKANVEAKSAIDDAAIHNAMEIHQFYANLKAYNLDLISATTTRSPKTLYIQEIITGLHYEVIGLDGILKNNIIAWDELPPDFPRGISADNIQSLKNKILTPLIDYTAKAGHTHHPVTEKELENFRIIKSLAIIFMTSYILMEDDLHQNNISKLWRIDHDMSLWPLLYYFKDETLAYFRQPTVETFKITEEVINNFPYVEAKRSPYYWPTNPPRALSNIVSSAIGAFFMTSTNPYPHKINILYQKLQKNPIFVHYKLVTLAKYILTTESTYQKIALQHIRADSTYDGKLLYSLFTEMHGKRIDECKKILLGMPVFTQFFKQHHRKIVAELENELNTQEMQEEKTKVAENCADLLKLIDTASERSELKFSTSPTRATVTTTAADEKTQTEAKAVKSSAAKSLDEIKLLVTTKMDGILNPWFSAVRTINHSDTAIELINFCKVLTPEPSNMEANLKALLDLKAEIAKKLLKIPTSSGNMRPALETVLVEINKIVSPSPDITKNVIF